MFTKANKPDIRRLNVSFWMRTDRLPHAAIRASIPYLLRHAGRGTSHGAALLRGAINKGSPLCSSVLVLAGGRAGVGSARLRLLLVVGGVRRVRRADSLARRDVDSPLFLQWLSPIFGSTGSVQFWPRRPQVQQRGAPCHGVQRLLDVVDACHPLPVLCAADSG